MPIKMQLNKGRVPVGFNQHEASKVRGSAHQRTARQLSDRLDQIVGKHPGVMKMQRQFAQTWICQLGSSRVRMGLDGA
jgi:tRNA-splicing ligase RtcB